MSRSFGSVRKLPSGRHQARYTGPDRRAHTGRTAAGRALTFSTTRAARGYLSRVDAAIQAGTWKAPGEPEPAVKPVTFAEYAAAWLASRELSPSTRRTYAGDLRVHLIPEWGELTLTEITPARVRVWYAGLAGLTGKTARAHAYALLRSILTTAVADEIIPANPCKIRGAGQTRRERDIEPATLAELQVIADAMPLQYQLMVLLAAWCALRFGELAELRREDVDLAAGKVRVRRAVTRGLDGRTVKDPKSAAGRRDVAIPPHLMPAVREHLAFTGPGALLFPSPSNPGAHLSPSSLYWKFYPAREAAGRPDLRFHDLRHTGATLAATTGATLAELMARLGHSTVAAAMKYQHAAADRDQVIAAALSQLAAGATVTPISQAPSAAASS